MAIVVDPTVPDETLDGLIVLRQCRTRRFSQLDGKDPVRPKGTVPFRLHIP